MLADAYRTDPRSITKVVAHPEYRRHEPYLVSFMARSRELRADPEKLLSLQAEMVREVIALQASQRDYQAEIDAGKLEHDQYVAAVCKQLALGIRQIADGIAWRTLGYDRTAIHALVCKPQTGHMQPETAAQEIEVAATHVAGTGEFVILNDLTNCLRYGDFTSVGPNAMGIHEVKAGLGAARSGRALTQRQRTIEVIEFLKSRERRSAENVQRLVRLRATPRGHAHELAGLIREVRREGSAHARLSDCLAVEVFDAELMAQAFADGRAPPDKAFHNPFAQSKDAGTFHSLQHFDKFSPNAAPYSVFPLPNEDCVGIMTGSLWLCTYFNRGNFVRCLRRRGLRVRVPTDEELKAAPRFKPGELAAHELDNPIVIAGRSHVLLLSLGRVGQMIHELLDEESFADAMEEQLETAGSEEELVYAAFEDEASLWD